MMNLDTAISYGERIGVRFYVKNDRGAIMGGTKTREQAEEMKARFERDSWSPWEKRHIKYHIEKI